MGKRQDRDDRDEMDELLRQYRMLISGRGNVSLSEDSFERIIDHFDEEDELGAAIEAAEAGIGQYPFSATLLIKKADLLISDKRYRDALELLDQAEVLDSTDIDIWILRTDACLAMDQHDKAARLLEEAIDRFTGDERLDLLFELADVYDDYESFDKVFDCLRMILEEDPNNEEALHKICFWTDFTGRNEESIRIHRAIIDTNPYNELAWFNLASAFQGLRLYEKAVDAYQYAIAIQEKFDHAYRNMADAYIRLRKYREAIEALEKVVELSRPEEVVYEAIGHCYDRLRNPAQARFYFRKASHLNPEDAKLLHRIALTYMDEENWAQAARYLEMALRIARTNHEFNLSMGEVQLRLGRVREAVDHFNMVVKARPRNISGWEALIRCLYTAGFHEEAEGQCRAAYLATGGKPVLLFYRTAILFAMRRAKDALLLFEQAMQLAPRKVGRMLDLAPALMQNPQVAEIIARHRRSRPR
jgi:tetratricopeptide (TPR) repeat protein